MSNGLCIRAYRKYVARQPHIIGNGGRADFSGQLACKGLNLTGGLPAFVIFLFRQLQDLYQFFIQVLIFEEI